MTTFFVLLMVFTTNSSNGAGFAIQQEFTSFERCEVARRAMLEAHTGHVNVLRAQGCFQK